MEKKQYELMVEILRRFEKAGILKTLVLGGSWCLIFYREYFNDAGFYPSLRTRDIDFLVPGPMHFPRKTNVPEVLKDLGFVADFQGLEGYVRLIHPALIMEFLVPDK